MVNICLWTRNLKVNVEMADMFLDVTGTGPVSFTISNLPSGLYVDGSYIKGTPSASAQNDYTTSVMITATDDNGSQTKYVTFPIVTADVSWSATVTGIPTTLTRNSAMTAFTLFDSVIDAPTDKTFSVVGAKPSWLNLNTTSGKVSGTPTAEDAEETTVTFRIRETGNASNAANKDVTFPAVGAGSNDVSWSATVTGIPTTLTRNSAMTAFTLFDSIIDAPTDKTFSVVGAKPSWLNLNTSSGQVSGTPTAEDADETTVTFRIRETGNASNSC